MPKNYQISQYEEPLAEDGRLEIDAGGGPREIGIQRLHLEEDVGKLVHEGALETAPSSSVDFNRAGVPLMEIVARAGPPSPEEAAAYLRTLRAILLYLRRLRRQHGGGLAPLRRQHLAAPARPGRARHQGRDQEHELVPQRARRARVRDRGGRRARSRPGERIVQETRLWDADRGRHACRCARKEYAHDYRYFPEPDLPPLDLRRGLGGRGARAAARAAGAPAGTASSERLRALRPTRPTC